MNKKIPYIPLLGLGLAIGLNVYFRCFPINFPQLAAEARSRVESQAYQRSVDLINKNYANLSPMARSSLVKVAVQEYQKQNKQKIAADVVDAYNRMKDRFQDKSGQTYLFELDCWHWARYVENTVRTGHPGDTVVNGQERDLLMNHPDGVDVVYNRLFFYVCAFLYTIVNFFVHIPLYTFLFYLPIFFSVVFIGALYLICWRFYGAIAATIASLFVGLAPIFLPRSCAGWFDMDVLNLLFPLLVVFSYLMVYSRAKVVVRRMWIGVSSLLVGLFAYTWTYWWFVVVVIILYEMYTLLNLVSEKLQYKDDIRVLLVRHIFSLVAFLLLSTVSVLMFCGTFPLSVLRGVVMNAVTLNKTLVNSVSVWPNVLSTVGELSRPSFSTIADFIGGPLLFVLSLISMLVMVLRNKRYRGPKRESIFLLVLWFIIVFSICHLGVRLIVFLIIPMGIFLGWGVREAFNYCMRQKRKKKYLLPILGLTGAILVGNFFSTGQRVAKGLYPMIDDSWYILLTNIKQNTPTDAVLNSWWDFGDWFKVIAKRRVIFDGQSQNTPQGYWMAKTLLSDSEEEAFSILRMLNNGGNQAFDEIDKHFNDPALSLLLLEKVLAARPEVARKSLSESLPDNAVERVMQILYGRPPAAYFIVDYSMIGKMFPISYLGNWDAVRLYVVKNINVKTKEQILSRLVDMGVGQSDAEAMYSDARLIAPSDYNKWISHHARFYSGSIPGTRKGENVFFDNGLVYNIKDRTMFAFSGYDGKYRVPKSVFYLEGDRLVEKVYPDSNLEFSVLLLQDGDVFRAVQLDRELGQSLFTKLYFLKGKGLRYFKPFTDNGDAQNYIGVFEIDWKAR